MSEIEKVWFVDHLDSEADDRRGEVRSCADDYGVWLNEEDAKSKALELNLDDGKKIHTRLVQDYNREMLRYGREKAEYDALTAAGIEKREPKSPGPLDDYLTRERSWRGGLIVDLGFGAKVRLPDYYGVDSFEVNPPKSDG